MIAIWTQQNHGLGKRVFSEHRQVYLLNTDRYYKLLSFHKIQIQMHTNLQIQSRPTSTRDVAKTRKPHAATQGR